MVQRSLIFFAAINLILLYSATIANGKSLSRGKYLVDLSRYTQYGPIKNSRVKNQPSDFGKKQDRRNSDPKARNGSKMKKK